jgi:hypothetical protein
MTILTDIRGVGMISRFALRNTAIMTTDTGTQYLIMIQRCNDICPIARWHPMAGFTHVGGIWVITGFS